MINYIIASLYVTMLFYSICCKYHTMYRMYMYIYTYIYICYFILLFFEECPVVFCIDFILNICIIFCTIAFMMKLVGVLLIYISPLVN